MLRSRIAFLVIATLCLTMTIQAQVISNPSFENPGHNNANPFIILSSGSTYITDWRVGGRGVDYFRNDTNPIFASDGLYSVNYVRGPGEGGSVSTVISDLIVGNSYELSFDVIQRDLGSGTALTATVASTSQTYINSVSAVWERRSLFFTANALTATLIFAGPTSNAVDSPYAHVDNVSIRRVVTVGGIIALQGTENAVQPIDFTFRPTLGSAFTRTATLNFAGGYTLDNIPVGEYTVSIKGTKWLRKNITVDARSGNVSNADATLLAGDANNDNAADISDLLLLIAHYNKVSPNAGFLDAADFNSDGVNDIADLLLLVANYNKQGDS